MTRKRNRLGFEQLNARLLLDGGGITLVAAGNANPVEQNGSAFVQTQQSSTALKSGGVASEPVAEQEFVDITVSALSCVRKVDPRGREYTSCRQDPASVLPGGYAGWSFGIMNNPIFATTEATNVEIAIELPAEVTFTRFVGDGSYDASTGIWSRYAAWPGEPISFRLEAVVDDNVPHGTVLKATAELISVDQQDFNSTPNNDDGDQSEDDEASASAIISNSIDLELTAFVNAGQVRPDSRVFWTVQLTNNESASRSATGVTVSSSLPDSLDFERYTTTNGNYDPLTQTWTLLDPLAPGETAELQITTVPKPGLPGLTRIEINPFVATADQFDSDSTPGNTATNEDDQDSANVRIDRLIDLELTQSADVDEVNEGDLINLSLTLTNNAEDANYRASDIRIQHTVSEGLKYLNASTSADGLWAQDVGDNKTLWTIQSLAPGNSVTIDLLFEVVGTRKLDQITSHVEVVDANLRDVDSTPNNSDPYFQEDDEAYLVISVAPQLSISGLSYLDTNNDGVHQSIELPIRNTQIRLEGIDVLGQHIELVTTTNRWGYYQFTSLRQGHYQVTQIQAPQFLDGIDSLGDLRGSNSINDRFIVHLTSKAKNYNFGERGINPSYLSRFLGFEYESLDGANTGGSIDSFRVWDEEQNTVVSGFQLPSEPYHVSRDEQYSIEFNTPAAFSSAVGGSAQVSVHGGTVIAVGTDGDDIVELQFGDTLHILSINGVRFEFEASFVRAFHLGGSTGHDEIIVRGTDNNDTASVLGDRGEFSSSHYRVDTYSFENTTFVGGGGNDLGQLYGSLGDDVFESFPHSYTMRTPEHQMHIADFDRVDGYGRAGNDQALLYGTNEADSLRSTHEFTIFAGPGHRSKTKGFERIDAYGRGGVDLADLQGSAGDERFISTLDYNSIVTADRKVVAKDFELVQGYAIAGGIDLAYLYHWSEEEQLELWLDPGYWQAQRSIRTEFIVNYQIELVDRLQVLI